MNIRLPVSNLNKLVPVRTSGDVRRKVGLKVKGDVIRNIALQHYAGTSNDEAFIISDGAIAHVMWARRSLVCRKYLIDADLCVPADAKLLEPSLGGIRFLLSLVLEFFEQIALRADQ